MTISKKSFIRGVNIGGWLVLERYITPYMFALTDCHVKGDFCWFQDQISAPPANSKEHQYCDMYLCQFLLDRDDQFVAVDEYTLASQFKSKVVAREYLTYHWDNFVLKEDIFALKEAGVTHVRVPVPHWMMGDIREDEPWVDGQWPYFLRLVSWCREYGIEVWVDIHTAPGSQNGFDNSGILLDDAPTCRHWTSNLANVERSLKAVRDIAEAVTSYNIRDVVTGFGVLNEPFADCDVMVVKEFYDNALEIVRKSMGHNTSVYIGDMFNATKWNDGWWTDEDVFANTFLDSHYYHVFDENDRKLSPKQHIALVCGKDARATESCCYQDAPKNTEPSRGISRIIGEWSAAYDSEPEFRMHEIMNQIREKQGETSNFKLSNQDRLQSKNRWEFMRNFVEAQMVVYESPDSEGFVGLSRGWFYWTLKMEFAALGEWDFLRGLKEHWIPKLPTPNESSESIFGSCREIAKKTEDYKDVAVEFPDPETTSGLWSGPPIDDDFVLSHAGEFYVKKDGASTESKTTTVKPTTKDETEFTPRAPSKEGNVAKTSKVSNGTEDRAKAKNAEKGGPAWFPMFCVAFFAWGIWKVFLKDGNRGVGSRRQY
eukprot:CAMPEP_0176126060 /NCGR_PEP_ID=MMETSP0120_2-20121206/63618_1 /TAXON_ID=160619 /ORGANISM="Kryptoperidinium foliaceum, Strain CCMP 1326" /LENGTH=597 /DNA_ID=CAMNT_0017460969 /DNA_START=36 /DNA_END=1826 /DNA_ORIENTATION=-